MGKVRTGNLHFHFSIFGESEIEKIVEKKVKEALEKRKQTINKNTSTIDDLLELRGEPRENKSKIQAGTKQIVNLTKEMKKCQILNN